ncbi:YDG domain-containing protein [Janthinobacterium sp. RB2R34]|uniref:YDG domain-containing protein n=1 Tax=Janthinobacterium sp. RB2R34 TaxID=3424193 RepID=UPI003F253B67
MTKQKPSRIAPVDRTSEPPLRRTALALLIAACFNAAHANPVLPQVVHGQATFNQQGNLFTITNTPNTIINWQSFSVNQGEITRFVQQNAGSSVLNRITGQDPSKILGSLQSNGKVFLINPNGVLFGRDARVDVAGLVASSLALSNQDFLAGKMNFNAGEQAGAVLNQGAIHAGSGGQILLIAPNVENSGIITAPNGDVLLAAGHSVQLADAANPDLRVVLSAPADRAINVGQIVAQGGRIGMVGALLNQRGVLNANSAVLGENGKIVLKATGKALLENGSVTTATSTAGKGGEVTVLGDQVGMQGDARVDVSGVMGGGTVLLGGDYQGKNPAISNARQVAMDSGASIKADAVANGDGGKVIVWGDQTARVLGSISARGGAASGNGGLVETSGHYLDIKGIRVDTASSRGKRGNWLIDPYDIDVVAVYPGELGSFDDFGDAPSTGTASIGADTISNASSNVTLQATHQINFNSAINMANPGVGLSAIAGESINVNSPITTSAGAVVLSANDATGGTFYGYGANLNLNAAINTNGGNAYLSGASVTGAGTVNTKVGFGDLTLRANNANGGITLTSTDSSSNQLTGNTLQLQADNITFGLGLIRGNNVTLTPMSPGRQITLGVVGAKPADSLGLTNNELGQVIAGTLTIGGSNAGTINQTGSLSISDHVTNLVLNSGTGINLDSFFTVLHNLKLNVGGGGNSSDNLITSSSPLIVGGEFFLEGGNWVQNNANLPAFSASGFNIGSGTFLRVKGGNGDVATPYQIADVYGLQGIATQSYNKNYILAANIDASGTASWTREGVRTGFTPLFKGDDAAYEGIFDGAGHSISGLTINGGANPSFFGSGLFARVQGGTIRNLAMLGGSVTGGNNVGAVVGNNGGTISNVSSSMAVSGNSNVGGLVGNNDGNISQAYATGGVGGGANVGGLVGRNGGTIEDVYATGAIGLASNSDETLARQNLGGVIGWSVVGSSASRLYFSGHVSGNGLDFNTVGAVIGRADSGAVVEYAYFNGDTAGTPFDRGGASGRSTAQMQQQAQFGGFNFGENAVWRIYDGYTTPMLKAFLTPLAVSASGAASKVYDGVLANAGTLSYVGLTNGDVAASGTASYGNAVNVGNYALGGLWSTKYDITYAGTTTLAITPRALSVILGGSKVYDGQVGFANAILSLGNTVSNDTLGVTGTAQFVDKNAGAAKQVNLSGLVLSGNELGNYSLAGTATGTAEISRASLSLASVSAASKVYDGSTSASLSGTLAGVIGGDQVQLSGASANFADKNVGASKDVNYSVGGSNLGGSDAGNYVLNTSSGKTSAGITARTLNLGFTGVNKTYDGGTNAAVTVTDNRVSGDVLTTSATGVFADKNAGSGKTVTVQNASLSGLDAANYVLSSTTGASSATISQRELALGFNAAGKTYDGNTAATVTVTDNRIAGDVLTATAIGAFADKNAGSNKAVTVQNASLSGTDAANYVLASTSGATSATITQRALALGFTAAGKTYDGNTAATVAVTDNRVAGDVLTATASGAFADKNAGSNKAVTVQNASLSGTDAANYVLASTSGAASATITQRALALGFNAAGKTYDGNTAATVAVTDNRVAGDMLTATATGAFVDKNAGANKAVTVQNASLSGTDAANYVLASTTGATSATITQRALALGFNAAGKTYDGNTAATVAVTDNRVAGDMLTATATGAFVDKNAGANKAVTVRNASLSGTDAANYVLASTTGATSATITQRALALGFTAAGKTYDGNTAATVAVTDNRVAGDVLTATASGAFADKNAGANKTVTVQSASLSGTDAANYTLASTTGATSATIVQRALALGFAAAGKTYDGNTAATVAVTDNRIAGDVLTATATGVFADKNAGANKTVTVQSASLSGTDAANYTLASTTGATSATITQRTLALGFAAAGKTYDGSTAATVAVTDNRIAGDVLTTTASGAFADKNAGSNKVVAVQNASLSGLDAGNYILATTSGTATASIAQRTLDLGYTGVDKVYDGATGAQVAISDDRIVGDVLSASASAAFVDKNAGTGKAVTVGNIALSGTDAGNYRLAATGGVTSASIARAALTLASVSASDKIYDGTQVASVSGTVAGVIGQDAVSLAGGSGTFADRNFGTGKTVAVGGFQLAGSDAGNYVLTSNSGVAQASIAQRALSTWIGASGGLWSDAANWEGGVAPSGANVLAADFAASTGNVVYTAAAGDTVLNSLNSRGGLNLTGGSLLLNNVLTVANYAQTGGLLGGQGNMTVSNSFSQSAGAINIGGNLAVNQAAGDLRFAALTANTIRLNAAAGAISQSGAVVAGSLATQSQTGTVLNDTGNRVRNFSASNSGAGGIALTNTSAPAVLVLGSVSTGAGDVRIESTGGIESHAINASSGNVTLIAHSPVNVQGVVNGNDVTIDASTDVAFGDGARVSAARAIAVTAGNGVTFAGASALDTQAAGSIAVLAKNGDLTAAETVRINSRGSPVSLLAPNGRVTVPASVLVAQPVTTPVLPPSTIISASNTLPALSEQYNPLNQFNTPNNVSTPLLASATSKESTKKATDDPQNGIKKTYCN